MGITDSEAVSTPDSLIETGLSQEQALHLYHYMRLTRAVEQRAINLYRQGRLLGPLYTAIGNEAVSVGSAGTLENGDVTAPLHRGMGVQIVRGTTPKEVYGTYMGRGGTGTNGKDGSLHIGSKERGIFSLISHLGAMRLRGHSEADQAEYVPKEMLEAWSKKDPVEQFERRLYEAGWLTDEAREDMEQRIAREIDTAVEEAEQSPMPMPEETLTDVYAD